MEVQDFTTPERRLSRAGAPLREQGVSDPQLAGCAERVDRDAIDAILNGAEPAWRAFVRAGAAATEDEERRAYVGLATANPQRLRSALSIEHPRPYWPAGRARGEVARLRERGVLDEQVRAAIERVGLRGAAEALAGPDNLGWGPGQGDEGSHP